MTQLQTVTENLAYHRKRTIDLLDSLSENDLLFTPSDDQGPLWKQFRHIGRVQENYLDALDTKKVKFSPHGKYKDGTSKEKLLSYLKSLDETLTAKLKDIDLKTEIDWYGESVVVDQHLLRLTEHELIHHGQFIVYLHALKKDFPKSWEVWGVV